MNVLRLQIYVRNTQFGNIHYNLIFTTKFNDSSILITIISKDYLILSSTNEYVVDVTISTHVINYNHFFLPADKPIRLKYSHQVQLYIFIYICHQSLSFMSSVTSAIYIYVLHYFFFIADKMEIEMGKLILIYVSYSIIV